MVRLCLVMLSLSSAPAAAQAADWPQWRGPDRDGHADGEIALPGTWPKAGPLKLWTSEKVLSAGWGGYGSAVVADGRVYVYCNWKTRVPFEERTLTADGLRRLGHHAEKPPADLVKTIEQARLSPERKDLTRNQVKDWVAKWIETHLKDEATRKKFGGFASDRLRRGDKAMDLGVLDKLSTIADKEFPDQAAFDKWFTQQGLDAEVRKAVMRHVRTYRDEGKDVVFCFNADDGTTAWKHEEAGKAHGRGLSCTPCVAGGRCYVIGSTGKLYCLDAGKGDLLWQADAHAVHSSPVVADGKVVALAGKLRAWNVADGQLAWEQPKVGGGEGSPIVWRHGERACVIVHHGKVACADLADGKLLWTAPGGGGSTPAAAGDRLIVATNNKKLGLVAYTISPEKAEQAWALPEFGERYASPILRDGHVYVVSGGKAACVALDAGKVLWTEKVGSARCSSPAMVGDVLVAALAKGRVAVIQASPKAPRVVGKAPLGVTDFTSPAVAGGRLYVREKEAVACYDLTRPAAPPEAKPAAAN